MSEKMKQLFEKLAQNPELKAELEKNPPKSAEDVIAVAARLGVELKKEELEAELKELPLDNADQLDGGYFAAIRFCCEVPGDDLDGPRSSYRTFRKPRPNENAVCVVECNATGGIQ